ncbi:MAG: amidohydrolase [Asgard group archaeon]|nr:amidohydrolase [Asgard group archaeon]
MNLETDNKQPHRIDIHHHILPPAYLSTLEILKINTLRRDSFPNWSIEQSIKMMDRQKIAKAFTSISSPGVYFKNGSFSRNLARICNEYSSILVRKYPERFGAFASLPLPDVEGALIELDYVIDELQLDGIVLLSNVNGKYLGEPEYEELFAELNKRKLTVFIHPNNPPKKSVNPFVEYTHEVTRTIASLLIDNRLLKYPDIKYILAYAGGTIPFSTNRLYAVGLNIKWSLLKVLTDMMKKTVAIKRMYFDTAAIDSYSLQALLKTVNSKQILFGSNFFWTPESMIEEQLNSLRSHSKINNKAMEAIEYKLAQKMLST